MGLCITIMLDFLAAGDVPLGLKYIKSNKNNGNGFCVSQTGGFDLIQHTCSLFSSIWNIKKFLIKHTKKRRWPFKSTSWYTLSYEISGHGYTFEPEGQGKNNGRKILLSKFEGKKHQAWNIERCNNVPGEVYVLRNIYNSERCLDDTGIAAVNHGYHLWDCNCNNVNQQFRIVPLPL